MDRIEEVVDTSSIFCKFKYALEPVSDCVKELKKYYQYIKII